VNTQQTRIAKGCIGIAVALLALWVLTLVAERSAAHTAWLLSVLGALVAGVCVGRAWERADRAARLHQPQGLLGLTSPAGPALSPGFMAEIERKVTADMPPEHKRGGVVFYADPVDRELTIRGFVRAADGHVRIGVDAHKVPGSKWEAGVAVGASW
jgi:hypothetical protein